MDNISYISLSLVRSKGSNTALPLLFLQRKLIYFINVVYEIKRHVFTDENTILNKTNIGKGSHTVTGLEKRSSHTTICIHFVIKTAK